MILMSKSYTSLPYTYGLTPLISAYLVYGESSGLLTQEKKTPELDGSHALMIIDTMKSRMGILYEGTFVPSR